LLSGLRAEGPSRITRAPEEDIASFVVASTWACGISKVARAKASPGTPGVGAAATACAAAPTAAGIVVAAPGVAPTAWAAAPDGGGGGVSGGKELNPFVGPVRGGVRRGRKEGWVVNPTFVVVNVFLDLLDDVVEGADGFGEVIRVKFSDRPILGGTLVGVVFCRFDETDEQLVREKGDVRGEERHFPGVVLKPILGLPARDEVEESHDAVVE